MIKDQMIYLVVLAHEGGAYMPEREIGSLDRAATVALIALGEWEGLSQVLECNPVEGTCRDVTEDFARDVSDIWAQDGEPLDDWQREFVEAHLGVSFANQFAQAAE